MLIIQYIKIKVNALKFKLVKDMKKNKICIFPFDLYVFNSLFNLKIWIFSKYMIILFWVGCDYLWLDQVKEDLN